MTWTRWSACHASSTCETSPLNPAWSAKGFQTTGVQVKAEGDLTFHEMLDGLAILLGGAAIQKFELYFLMYHHVRFMTHPLNPPTV